MSEEELFETGQQGTRNEIAEALLNAAEQIEPESVQLKSERKGQDVPVPENPHEVELERFTDSETVEERYELEHEIRWKKCLPVVLNLSSI
jgi:hypothetical protein